MFKVILFDAYGTLFDVYSVGQIAEAAFPEKGATLAKLWRDKQLEYSRLRALSGRYKSFWGVTEDALDFAVEALGLAMTAGQRQVLLNAYASLKAFPENRQVLSTLRDKGIDCAILSNGNPEMIHRAVDSAGLGDCLSAVLSVEPLQTFKTDPRVYQMGLDAFGVNKDEALFVSSNGWDACGAAWFGLTTVWLNRAGLPKERLDVTPAFEARSLDAILEIVGA